MVPTQIKERIKAEIEELSSKIEELIIFIRKNEKLNKLSANEIEMFRELLSSALCIHALLNQQLIYYNNYA
jgi:hypothetical protein